MANRFLKSLRWGSEGDDGQEVLDVVQGLDDDFKNQNFKILKGPNGKLRKKFGKILEKFSKNF